LDGDRLAGALPCFPAGFLAGDAAAVEAWPLAPGLGLAGLADPGAGAGFESAAPAMDEATRRAAITPYERKTHNRARWNIRSDRFALQAEIVNFAPGGAQAA
jgi:hypothetical protein